MLQQLQYNRSVERIHERSELLGCACIIICYILCTGRIESGSPCPCHTFKILGILGNKRSLWYIFGGCGHSFHWVVGAVKLWGQEMIRDKARSTEGSEGCDGVRMCVEGKSKCVYIHILYVYICIYTYTSPFIVLSCFPVGMRKSVGQKICNYLRVQVEFSTTTYNALLDVCARSGEICRAEPLLKQMADQGWADSRLHSMCYPHGAGVRILYFASALAGLVPSIITYSTVIKAYCASNQLQQAFKLFEDLLKREAMKGFLSAHIWIVYTSVCI